MNRIYPTPELLKFFQSKPETLIFEGYCRYTEKTVIWQDRDSFALVAPVGDVQKTCVVTQNVAFADEVLSNMHGKVELCGIDPALTEHFRSRYKLEWETNCLLFAWNGQPLPRQNVTKTYPIPPQYAQMISDGTFYRADTEEIKQCLALHPSEAIFVDGKPVCWCLCHLEKSLGMLYTVPEYRHRGYTLEVMTALCNDVIRCGDVPYAYIVKDNVASINLAAKYNLAPVKYADYALIVKQ